MVAHVCNPSAREEEVGDWSTASTTQQGQGQPELHETRVGTGEEDKEPTYLPLPSHSFRAEMKFSSPNSLPYYIHRHQIYEGRHFS